MDLRDYTIRYGVSVIVFTAAAGWWTDSIEVVVSATVWMLHDLLGISFSAIEALVTRSSVLMLHTLGMQGILR